jgi:signal peptidase I
MSKPKHYRPSSSSSAATQPGEKSPSPPQSHFPSPAAIREAVESVVIAFVLAFLFRTFEAEAFVIPTGSMAPTLMGRHKDLHCPKCGSPYQLSASDEVDNEGTQRGFTTAGTCPMCRYTADLSPDNPQHEKYPSYNGDRILVSKFAYQFREPRRWEIIVFKFPGDQTTDSRTNFIKRLIGLPGETIRIRNGDIWVRDDARGEKDFHIARKPPDKLLAMLQPVFDNDYMPAIAKLGWPERWRAEPPGGWQSDGSAAFKTDGRSPGENWLRYEHRVPSYWQWPEKAGAPVPDLQPQWITDFTAYDTSRERGDQRANYPAPPPDSVGNYWVGDLALSCAVELEGREGELIFELRKGGRWFQCRADIATGQATLSISGEDQANFHPTAQTTLKGPGRHTVRFSNCDDQLLLWIDDKLVRFDAPTDYPPLGNDLPDRSDLTPVGIASVGAAAKVEHLAVFRDLYYIAHLLPGGDGGRHPDNDPAEHADFRLKADQFFALGDNSARSKDGRLWGFDNHYVPRELLIGKALFIYWPHSWNRTPGVNIPFPYFPNFSRMGLVR